MICLSHNWQKESEGTATKYSLYDLEGEIVDVITYRCSKCLKKKRVES